MGLLQKAETSKHLVWKFPHFMDGNEVIEDLQDRIRGRWSAYDIIHPETGEIIVPADTMITVDQAEAVEKAGIKKVWIRTVLTCRSEVGICAKCYGANMASGRICTYR